MNQTKNNKFGTINRKLVAKSHSYEIIVKTEFDE